MNRWLGVDVKLDEDGAILVRDGDFARIEGEECLLQDLRHRLLTAMGDLLMHPDFGAGLPDEVGKPLTAAAFARLKALVRRQILADPRVKEVDLELWQQDTGLFIRAIITTIGGRVEIRSEYL